MADLTGSKTEGMVREANVAEAATHDDRDERLRRLDYYRSEIRHEFNLLSNRVAAYAGAQSFLVIAYTTAMGNLDPVWGRTFTLVFPLGLAALGIVTSITAGMSIDAAADTIALWHAKQMALMDGDPSLDVYRLQRPTIVSRRHGPVDAVHRKSLVFALLSPRVFLVAWIAFAGLTIALHAGLGR